jgi:hypothetical protein
MRTYTIKAVEDLINEYIKRDGEIVEVIEGGLGHGTTICSAFNCKYSVIQEIFLNEWSSTHTIRMYKKLPKKYEKLLQNI